MPFKRSAGVALNVATGGTWGLLKWIGRRFKGEDGRTSFLGRVSVFVTGHAIFSMLTGAISPWEILKIIVRAILYLSVAALHMAGGEGRLPGEEQANLQTTIHRIEKTSGDKMEEMQRASLSRIAELGERIETLQKKSQEQANKAKIASDVTIRFQMARAKAEKLEALREAARLKASIRLPNLFGSLPPRDIERENDAVAHAWYEQLRSLNTALARGGVRGPCGVSDADREAYDSYLKKGIMPWDSYDSQAALMEEWNAFERTNTGFGVSMFIDSYGVSSRQDPGPLQPPNFQLFP